MTHVLIQTLVFTAVLTGIALLTYLKCRDHGRSDNDSNREYFLAGGSLTWLFVAGSITLTNLSTDQLVGMNGNQMILLAVWELAGFVGLLVLAKIFLPVYYRNQCTTTTELLEKRYQSKHLRAAVSMLFLFINVFVFQPAVIYTGALFMLSMTGVDFDLIVVAAAFAVVGAAYAVVGGLRAVAVSDTYGGIIVFIMGLLVVWLALDAIRFDFSGIPAERLTLLGDSDSPVPWHTLLTGMILIQIFYWSTNQTITQRAMAAPSVKEAQKGVYAAALVRVLLVPPMVVIPGVVAYKLYGDIGDAAYGQIVGDLMPSALSGAFAAAIAADAFETVIVIKDHRFLPDEIKVPAGQSLKLLITIADQRTLLARKAAPDPEALLTLGDAVNRPVVEGEDPALVAKLTRHLASVVSDSLSS